MSKRVHAGAALDDDADDLVTGDQRQRGIRQFAVDDVQIGAAHAAGMHAQQDLAAAEDVEPTAPAGPAAARAPS